MSLVARNSAFVRDQWGELPKVNKDPLTWENAEPQDVVPEGRAELMGWAYVLEVEGSSTFNKHYALLYKTVASCSTLCSVRVRVQGFILKCSIEPLGNWNGDELRAAGALQSLTLHGGDHKAPFLAQCAALRNIRELVFATLRVKQDVGGGNGRLYLSRRVFSKKQPGDTRSNLLAVEDDVTGCARLMSARWIVATKLQLAYQDSNDKIRACNYKVFRPGDFVDITVVFDIFTRTRESGREHCVFLSMERIIQLQAVGDAVKNKSRPQPSASPSKLSNDIGVRRDFDLDETEGEP